MRALLATILYLPETASDDEIEDTARRTYVATSKPFGTTPLEQLLAVLSTPKALDARNRMLVESLCKEPQKLLEAAMMTSMGLSAEAQRKYGEREI